ncbi:Hydrophobin-3 [Psilocybe cubensis]|uniref:Hydrophobin n=2 Tax=Psilocybe cubensis TaxID=181762 RepID=A0A8H8CPE2_PSICU|nr:Hydrophobin-3 [Psilocybe cubensis]KAH9484577.1 Hydrophobin-3 [Psilocybe cubensis]
MFARVYSVLAFVLFFAGLAAATTTTVTVTTFAPGATPTTPASQCNTDSLFCCNFASQANALGGVISFLLSFAQIAVSPVTALVGADCTSLLVGNSCSASAQPVCCQNNNFAGALVIGCTPVNVNL